MIEMFEATIIKVALHDVSYTIDHLLEKLKLEGKMHILFQVVVMVT